MDSDKVSAQGGRLEVNALETVVGRLPEPRMARFEPVDTTPHPRGTPMICLPASRSVPTDKNCKIYVDAPSKDRKRQAAAVQALKCQGMRASIWEVGEPRAIRSRV